MDTHLDVQEICKYLEKVYKHIRNVSKKFQKDFSSRTKDIEQFSQVGTETRNHTPKHGTRSRADPTRGWPAKKLRITPLGLL